MIRALLLVSLTWTALASAAMAAEYTITIDRMAFGPVPADLRVGDVIVWRNDDMFRHTATARDDSFDLDIKAKSEARMTLESAGSFDFYCRLHPGMTGVLAVAP
ncbi:MAG: amicyanin [Pelagibacterium sp. SCN 63-23]|nr:MAG: amicyanin [Pelagibacterium sp. SCN 63-23]